MNAYTLELDLLSDAAFGRGDGVAGLVDVEVQHDESGLPTVSGRAIKGLLVNECAEILYSLAQILPPEKLKIWQDAALRLFGERGETDDQPAGLAVGMATLSPDLASRVAYQVAHNQLSREEVLDSLTAIRRQTAMEVDGAPRDESLRATRVVIRGVTLYAPLDFESKPEATDQALLAACVMSLRRAGTGRTRGKGLLKARLTQTPLDPAQFAESAPGPDLAPDWLTLFRQEVRA